MAKYKYEVYDHPSGRVARGDIVAAFVPTDKGTRVVTRASIDAINRTSVRVSYFFKGENYKVVLKDHQWCHIMDADEDIYNTDYINELQDDRLKLKALFELENLS